MRLDCGTVDGLEQSGGDRQARLLALPRRMAEKALTAVIQEAYMRGSSTRSVLTFSL